MKIYGYTSNQLCSTPLKWTGMGTVHVITWGGLKEFTKQIKQNRTAVEKIENWKLVNESKCLPSL